MVYLAPITPDNTLKSILEPLDGFRLIDTMAGANFALASSSLGDSLTGSGPRSKRFLSASLSFPLTQLSISYFAAEEEETTHMQQ